jgi:hypothetical protein
MTTTTDNLSAACGAWQHLDRTPAHDRCTGRVALPAPLDVCACLCHRPRALDYDRLTPGTWGYWPVLAAVPDDIAPGDRVSFVGDDDGDIVAEVVKGPELRSWPCRIGYRTPAGELLTIGRMARGFRLDRWARHASLSTRGAR